MQPTRSMLAIACVVFLSSAMAACDSRESPDSTASPVVKATETATVSPEIGLLAHRLVIAYMSDKAWGFFGATCEKWIETDYEWMGSLSEHQDDGRIKVTYARQPDRPLGPEHLLFYVDVEGGEVEGDNESETGRSSVAEGCDKW